MSPFCAAVDWGTSSFRLWLLARDCAVLAEHRSDEGMVAAMDSGFATVLEGHLEALGASRDLPVVVCGMAGARQGWKEAPYLDTPADLAALAQHAVAPAAGPRDVRILPGIAQRDPRHPDVMRGEETQLLGLVAEGLSSGLVCLPGTHSKWVTLRGGRVEAYATYMTGEMFAALSAHTILRLAIEGGGNISPDDAVFLAAVREAAAEPAAIANQLFSVRAAPLLGFAPRGAAGLSGALIGLELAGVCSQHAGVKEAVLVSSGRLGALYRTALSELGFSVNSVDAEVLVRRGLLSAALTIWS